MYVQCLGCGDAFGSGGRLNTSFYIRAGQPGQTTGVLLDCGASTSVALKKAGLSVDYIDAILVSHFHGDHFGGIPVFIKEAEARRDKKKSLTIIGPEEVAEKSEEALQCFYPGRELQECFPTTFLTYEHGTTLEFKGFRIRAFPAKHSKGTHAHSLRMEADGRVLAFSGDTEWTSYIPEISRHADLFLCEASFLRGHHQNHLSVEELVSRRPWLQTNRIVLTHAGEEVLNSAVEIPFEMAGDGMVLMED